jgi:hypothetical protein
MANSDDIAAVFEMLQVAYPNAKTNPKAPDVYLSLLGNVDGRLLRITVTDHIQHNKWFPTVAELIEGAHKASLSQPSASGAQPWKIYELEDAAVAGHFDGAAWEELAVELDTLDRTAMAASVRGRAVKYATCPACRTALASHASGMPNPELTEEEIESA